MAYIGKDPIVGNFQVCDTISVVNGQAAYTMQVSSVNVTPESANHMLVSLNGILQKPNSSFTVSGSTITFASNLATGDVIDFIMLLGNVLDIGTPSDSTVTDAKTNFVSTSSSAGLQIKGDGTTDGTLQLNCSQNSHGIKLKSPAHSAGQSYTLTFPTTAPSSGKALVTDGSGNLSFSSAGGLNLISTSTTSSGVAQIDITSGIDSTYLNYLIQVTELHPSSNAELRIRFFTGTGGSQAIESGSSKYRMGHLSITNSGSTLTDFHTDNYAEIGATGVGNEDNESFNANFYLRNPSGTTFDSLMHGQFSYADSSDRAHTGIFNLKYQETTAITGIRFYMSGGNIDSATIKLYGIS